MTKLDESEWVECYRAWEKPLYNIVYRVVWDVSESQDIVQDAFLRCWRKRLDIRADGFKALVFRTALNLARSRRRRVRIWQFIGIHSMESDSRLHCHDQEPVPDALRTAIEELPEDLRNALLLTELAGMSYTEIAEILGVREGTVGSRRTRAIHRVRKRLGIREAE